MQKCMSDDVTVVGNYSYIAAFNTYQLIGIILALSVTTTVLKARISKYKGKLSATNTIFNFYFQ